MGDGRGDVEGRPQAPVTLSLVNRCLEEHDKDITWFRRPRVPSFSPPLAALPASAAGARVGYARVSTKGQLLDRQIAALEAAGCARSFADKKSSKNAEREELWAALGYLRPGGTRAPTGPNPPGKRIARGRCLLRGSLRLLPKGGFWTSAMTSGDVSVLVDAGRRRWELFEMRKTAARPWPSRRSAASAASHCTAPSTCTPTAAMTTRSTGTRSAGSSSPRTSPGAARARLRSGCVPLGRGRSDRAAALVRPPAYPLGDPRRHPPRRSSPSAALSSAGDDCAPYLVESKGGRISPGDGLLDDPERIRSIRARAASHPGSQHVDLTARRERVEAVLDQPANCQQAS
ncbi:recombinase family protein [Streptomyces sp. NPDC059649]|uniref:recombinase family protein n=1 Tax=Streptomyces sp. NPDC059649 TaxID=3346895 RepID=UPI0036A087B7